MNTPCSHALIPDAPVLIPENFTPPTSPPHTDKESVVTNRRLKPWVFREEGPLLTEAPGQSFKLGPSAAVLLVMLLGLVRTLPAAEVVSLSYRQEGAAIVLE